MKIIERWRLLPRLWKEVLDGVELDCGKLTRLQQDVAIRAVMETLLIVRLAYHAPHVSPWRDGCVATQELELKLEKYFVDDGDDDDEP